jgi:cobalt-zinc-cadmium resistance protein CzcA
VEVEQYVTVPVERAMAGVPKSTEVRSISKYGLSVVTVVFEDGTDIYWARQLVNERMREAQDAVPSSTASPRWGRFPAALGEIFQFVGQERRADADAAGGATRLVHRARSSEWCPASSRSTASAARTGSTR